MRWIASVLVLLFLAPPSFAQSSRTTQASSGQAGGSNAPSAAQKAPVIQTEKVQVPETMQAPPAAMSSQPGYMRPSQAKELLVKVWSSEQRIHDLLSQVHPEILRTPPDIAATLQRQVTSANKRLDELEHARARFAGRPDSEYFGFETYAGMSLALPALSDIADTVYRYQNQSLGGDIRQSWNDLFTLEQALRSYISFLTRNHDQIFALTQGNLYNCQNQLNYAMRNKTERAKPMKNILPAFKGHPRHRKKPSASAEQQKPH
jgi:hypothetical protein